MSGVAGHCSLCQGTLESTHRHDYSVCECGKSMLDGGNAGYIRKSPTTVIDSVWDWTTADGRRLKAAEISDEHFKNIIKDGYELQGEMLKEAKRRGLI